MADLYEPDYGTAYYRSRDPVKNIKVKIRLERVTSTSIVPQVLLENDKNSGAGDSDLTKKTSNVSTIKDIEEYTFKWQEKVFSQREVEFYSHKENCADVLGSKYHDEVTKLLDGGRPTDRLFSYVSHDKFTSEKNNIQYMTTSPDEKPTLLAERAANVRRRKMAVTSARDNDAAIVPRINIVDVNPSEETIKQRHVISTPVQSMYIMADFSPKDRDGTEEDEFVLCTVKVDSNGVISVKPDFNKGNKPYRIETTSIGRDVFEYTVQHSSKQMNRLEQDRERKMYKELYNRHSEFLSSCVGQEFEMTPPGVFRVIVYGEIISAQDFEYNDLYIHYFIELPKNWRVDNFQELSGVTQTCRTKIEGRSNVCYFSFPFNFELFYKKDLITKEKYPDELPGWPQLFFEVLSLDSWQRYRPEGYGYMTIPISPGVHSEEINCWRPLGNSRTSEMRRFFIGGSPQVDDLTYLYKPSMNEGSTMSKFGFKTESTGSIKVKLNCIHQSRAFLDSTSSKKKVGSLLERLGGNLAQSNIFNVLDAFQRARHRMMSARENLPQNLKTLTLDAKDNEMKTSEL